MISTSQKEHLTYTVIGQGLILVLVGIGTMQYIIPGINKINETQARANTAVEKYNTIFQDGIPLSDLTTILWSMQGKEELLKIINSAQAETETAIKKTGNTDYQTWLKKVIEDSSSDKDRLIQAKQKLNSILPTLSPISNNFDEENITLKQYIRYIEWILIKKYGVDENMTLGLQGITYGDTASNMPKNIGSFTLAISFDWTNKTIQDLLNYINDSGNGEILNNTGRLSPDQIPGIMTNPLITIESFTLDNYLDTTKPDGENSGRATIRFFVRWGSKEDITFLKEAVSSRKTELNNKIKAALDKCQQGGSLCSQGKSLQDFQDKVTDLFQSMDASASQGKWDGSLDTLVQYVRSIHTLEDEFTDLLNNK
jgi:hypothetical protein